MAHPRNAAALEQYLGLALRSLEQLQDLLDRSDGGLILIGMPSIEKWSTCYRQVYCHIDFLHAFPSLCADEVRRPLAEHWSDMRFMLPAARISDEA
jgi:hypothetical protein